jgi:peptidoglycan-N-acetylglucosamine deacetylase
MITPSDVVEVGVGSAVVAGLVVGGYAYAANWPSSQIFGATLTAPRNPENAPGEIALTFDDGPNPRWTPILLEILARHNVRATFFLLGKYAIDQRPLVREMHDAGHVIGNHTWSHPHLARTDKVRTREELTRTKSELEQTIGAPIRFFRPPFGSRRPATLRIARELGLIPVVWNAMTADWDAAEAEQVTPRLSGLVERNQKRGYATNIVLHDGSHRTLEVNRSASVAAAGQLVERFGATYRFVTLDVWKTGI